MATKRREIEMKKGKERGSEMEVKDGEGEVVVIETSESHFGRITMPVDKVFIRLSDLWS